MRDCLADELTQNGEGIWQIQGGSTPVSYPQEGHRLLFAIEDDSWWFGHRNRVIETVLRRFPPAGALWDIGGGNGAVAAYLQRANFPCIMLDSGIAGCRNARSRGVANVLCAALENLHFRPGSMPAALLFDVLEHLAEPAQVLATLHNALRNDGTGMIYITVPAHPWLWSQEDEWAGHFTRYTLNSLHGLLQKAGFSICYHTYFFSYLSLFVALFRALPYRFHQALGRPSKHADHSLSKAHEPLHGLARAFIDRYQTRELRRIANGRSAHGSSIFIVAAKQP